MSSQHRAYSASNGCLGLRSEPYTLTPPHCGRAQEPWPGMSVGAVFYAVVYEDARPPVPADMPLPYCALMEECWSADAANRPVFPGVQTRLSALFRELRAAAMSKAQSS